MAPKFSTDITPLIRAISNGDGVIYVGAGASIDAGLPNWKGFLDRCLKRAELNSLDNNGLTSVSNRINSGDFLVAAEILQNLLEADLPHLIRETFAHTALKPTEIHNVVASMPFPLALTTNYDRLLELAYPQTPPTLSWQRAEDILLFMREKRFAVVKIHGDVANQSSLVLTRTNYRKLIHLNEAFRTCFKTLLLTKTFLFVGCSLGDHDLLSLIDEARSEFDAGFGPHYAIMLKSEVDSHLSAALRDCYRINIIEVDATLDESDKCRLSKRPVRHNSVSSKIAGYLTEIAGKVARERSARERVIPVFNSLFSLRTSLDTIARHLADLCGAQRVDIFLVDSEARERKAIFRVGTYSIHDRSTRFFDPPELYAPETIQGRLFLQRKVTDDYVYINDMSRQPEELENQGYGGLDARQSHNDSESLLACPIYSDGRRSGVVVLEAERKHAFTTDHLEVLKQISREIGWAQFEASQRQRASRPLSIYASDMIEFSALLNKSRLLSDLKLKYLLYVIDSFNGQLKGYYVDDEGKNCIKPFLFDFEDGSLAVKVLDSRRKLFYLDASDAAAQGFISEDGVKSFKIRGPIYGLPINGRGVTSGVLVCWSEHGCEVEMSQFRQSLERTRRMVHLVANDPARSFKYEWALESTKLSAGRFIQEVNDKLTDIDHNEKWTKKNYHDRRFRISIINSMLECLLHESCGLRRVRLWVRDEITDSTSKFKCLRSITRSDSSRSGSLEIDQYVGKIVPDGDLYGEYICHRAKYDPYARELDELMLGGRKEKLREELDKAKDAPWIIAPITQEVGADHAGFVKVFGFIAADMHYWDNSSSGPTYERVSDDVATFHRYCIDIVTDIISIILREEIRPRRRQDPPSPTTSSGVTRKAKKEMK
jgi:GAF domain-containing protein